MIMESLLAAAAQEEGGGGAAAEGEAAAATAREAQAYARHVACGRMGLPCLDTDGQPCWYCGDGDGDGCEYLDDLLEEEEEEDDDDEEEEEDDEDADGEEEDHHHQQQQQQRLRSGPATFCGFKRSFLCQAPASGDHQLLSFALPQKQQLTAQEAQENAEELVAEEERLKRKAEKKRMKKKRQKDRKRQEKRDQELKSKHEAETPSHSGTLPDEASAPTSGLPASEGTSGEACPGGSPSSRTEEVEEELDLSSTFVSKARLKMSTRPLAPKKEKTAQPERTDAQEKVKPEGRDPRYGLQMTPVEQSMVLADRGNESAKQGHYQEAVLLFTEAVKLNPREYRFFGNRSFCYERLQCYAEALRDAQLALSLQPGWPKGLFRQGKALMGLKRYVEAASTFEQLLQLGDFRSDAAVLLKRCQLQHLLESSFCGSRPDWGPWAREAYLLLSGDPQGRQPLASAAGSARAGGPLASLTVSSSGAKGPGTSAGQAPARDCFAVWVGNLTPKVTQEVLLRYFQPFGPIHSMRHLPRRFCAFINYTQKEAAEAAYATLQGAEVEGSKLLLQLKHPVHATPGYTKGPPGSSQQPLRGECPWSPPASSACSWLRSLGHLP